MSLSVPFSIGAVQYEFTVAIPGTFQQLCYNNGCDSVVDLGIVTYSDPQLFTDAIGTLLVSNLIET